MTFMSFAPEPNCGRGTFDNACQPSPSRPGSATTTVVNAGQFRLKLALWLGVFIFPEWQCVKAIEELHDARSLHRAVGRLAAPGWRAFTLRQRSSRYRWKEV